MSTTMSKKSVSSMSEEEIMKIVEAHRKSKERAKEYREKNKEKSKVWSERARIKNMIYVKKAKEMNLTVTEEEIDEYIANMSK